MLVVDNKYNSNNNNIISLNDYVKKCVNENTLMQMLPYDNRKPATMPVDYNDKQCITSKNDLIHVEFSYHKEHISYNIKNVEIQKFDDNTKWCAEIKSKKHINIVYKVIGQTTDTGRFGISIINMTVDVLINGQKDSEIIPKCNIISDDREIEYSNKDYIDANAM